MFVLKRVVFFVCVISYFTSCVDSHIDINKQKNVDIQYMSAYYNEPYDSILENISFQDTINVTSIGLRFTHFFDKRNIRRDSNDVHSFDKCKVGVYIKNLNTGNKYIYSKRLFGDYNQVDRKYQSIHNDDFRNFSVQDYFDTALIKDSFFVYYIQQSGVSMKVSSILNDLPKNIKSKLVRHVLDSVFIAFFYEKSVHSSVYSTVKDSFPDWATFAFLRYTHDYDSLFDYSNKILYSFYNHLRRNLACENIFTYRYPSDFINGFEPIIFLNEGFINDTSFSNPFYVKYDDETTLYRLRIYSPFMLWKPLPRNLSAFWSSLPSPPEQ